MKLALASIAVGVTLAASAFAQTAPQPPAESLAVNPIPADAEAEQSRILRSKIERAGYTEISELSRDSWGVWRGRAKKGDEVVDIVVDKGGRIRSDPR